MERLVETVLEDAGWRDLGLAPLAEKSAAATLSHLGLPVAGYAVSLLGCDDARMAALNGAFRGRPAATNVLSWPSADRKPAVPGALPPLPPPGNAAAPEELGDIAIARQTCQAEAVAGQLALADHVTHLLVHAVLHLLGFDHIRDPDAALMERLETEILAGLGIADPYSGGADSPPVCG